MVCDHSYQEVMMNVKFFKQKQPTNPQSNAFVNGIKDILTSHGITDIRTQNDCSQKLFKSSIELMKGISKGKDVDTLLKKETDEMKETLSKYGIESNEIQEDIILGYFALLGELAFALLGELAGGQKP